MAKKDIGREIVTVEDLPDHKAKQVEAGLATFHKMAQDVEDLRNDITNLQDDIGRREAQIDSLKHTLRVFEEQSRAYQEERDQAVADRCVYESLFASFRSLLDTFRIPTTPLVREQSEVINAEVFASRLADGLRKGLDEIDKATGHVPYSDGHGGNGSQ